MANIKTLFCSSEQSQCDSVLECYATSNDIFIAISSDNGDFDTQFILLDKETAIKLSKTLKCEISKI